MQLILAMLATRPPLPGTPAAGLLTQRARWPGYRRCHAGLMPRTWPQDWDAQRAGQGRPKCAEGRPAEDQWGIRFFAGPCDFTDEELTGYWTDVRTTAKAIERAYQPCQFNYTTFRNAVPHVHTHITPRYPDGPAPRRPTRCSPAPPLSAKTNSQPR